MQTNLNVKSNINKILPKASSKNQAHRAAWPFLFWFCLRLLTPMPAAKWEDELTFLFPVAWCLLEDETVEDFGVDAAEGDWSSASLFGRISPSCATISSSSQLRARAIFAIRENSSDCEACWARSRSMAISKAVLSLGWFVEEKDDDWVILCALLFVTRDDFGSSEANSGDKAADRIESNLSEAVSRGDER